MVKRPARGDVPVPGAGRPDQDPREPLDLQRAKIAHDINNPLAIVITNLDFALAELDSSPHSDPLRVSIQDARDAAARITSIVAEALALHPRPSDPPVPSSTRVALSGLGPGAGGIARMARVLVVDDEPSLGAALRRSLRDYDVVVTVSGHEALEELARGERFDFILCDLMMPGMSGDDVYREVKRVAPEQVERMVFITGGATTQRARDFLAAVPNPILEKPFDVNKLREMIRARIARG
jgi:CheY-like chemotaxis protein